MDCGDPPVLPDGSVTLDPGTTTFGSAANYECDEGYMFDSGSILTTRLCTASGEWSSGETCERKAINAVTDRHTVDRMD